MVAMSRIKPGPASGSSCEVIAVSKLSVHPSALKAYEQSSSMPHILRDPTLLTASDVHSLVQAHPISTVRTKSGGLAVIAGFRVLVIARACIFGDEIEVLVRPPMTPKQVSTRVFASLATAPLALSIGRSTTGVVSWRENLEAIRIAAGADETALSNLKSRNGLSLATQIPRSRLPSNPLIKIAAAA